MVDGIDVSTTCFTNTGDTGGNERCVELGRKCEKMHGKGKSRFVLVDPSGKKWKATTFLDCIKNSVRIARKFGNSKGKMRSVSQETPKPPPADVSEPSAPPPASTPPASTSKDYSKCSLAGKSGTQKDKNCRSIINACYSTISWPLELVTDRDSHLAKTFDQCINLARILAGSGRKFVTSSAGDSPPPPETPEPEATPCPSAEVAPPKPQESVAEPADPVDDPAPPPNSNSAPSQCERAGKEGSDKRKACDEYSIFCNTINNWPNNLTSIKKGKTRSDEVANPEQCMYSALILARGGYEFWVSGMPESKPEPVKKDSGKCEDVEYLSEISRERRACQPLTLNVSLDHYYSRRSRSQGEADLRKLCSTAGLEDTYLLIEGTGARNRTSSIWYEVGICETPTSTNSKFESTFSKGIMGEFAEVTTYSRYHFHPKDGYLGYGSEYPSPTDFESVINVAIKKGDRKMGYPAGVYDHRVVTTSGVWRLKPDFEKIRSNESGARKKLRKYSAEFGKINSAAYRRSSQSKNGRRFAKAVTSEYIQVTFHPF